MTTIVTVPGIMSDARTWKAIAGRLKSEGTALHVADTSRDTTLEDMAARALGQTDGELVVLAHSMGGRVAMEMGRQAPGRIRAMVLSNTNADGPSENDALHREARIAEANADMAAYAARWVPKVISAKSAQNAGLVAGIREMVEDCPAEVHERQNRALAARPDATEYLAAFKFPVLLVTGCDDHLSTAAVNDDIAARLGDAEFVVLENAGHLLPFEQPDRLFDVVSDWLARKRVLPGS